MRKKIPLWQAISIIFIAILLTFDFTLLFAKKAFNKRLAGLSDREKLFQKLSEVDSSVRNQYLFSDDIDESALADATVKGYIEGLSDKYAAYYSKEDYEKESNQDNGNYSGIGMTVSTQDDKLTVTSVLNGSPAKDAGIRKNDVILAVNGKTVEEESAPKVFEMLLGKVGDKLKIKILRDNQELNVSLTISEYELISVTQEIYGDIIGIVKITEFNDKTVEQFDDAMQILKDNNIENFVFDLRDNPGGLTTSVCKILDKLVGSGDLMVAEYKDGTTKTLFSSDSAEISGNMTVVVNENTASAAELFAKVMQDFSKAKIVGTTTYGKGVMQNIHKLTDGSAIKFTTAFYRSAKSDNFDGVGVIPDITAELSESQKNNPELSLEEDMQIQTAIKVLQSIK